jgi:hypothetical protein
MLFWLRTSRADRAVLQERDRTFMRFGPENRSITQSLRTAAWDYPKIALWVDRCQRVSVSLQT